MKRQRRPHALLEAALRKRHAVFHRALRPLGATSQVPEAFVDVSSLLVGGRHRPRFLLSSSASPP
jgi:hypothetical protein